ncbi:very long-chain fatty acid-CoA ligase [Aureococcus anophagefferens]|nr:very long-chain fatty acid-CoA ligase [Aureococcus anophagefferens]
MGLQSYPLPVRVCLAVLDLCWALATLELRRIFDLLLLLARVKLHGRRVSRAGATKWNVLVEWRRAVAEAPRAVAIARAEDRASPARLTYAEVDALSDEFAEWIKRTEPGGAGAVALLMGNSCAAAAAALGAARATLCVADADLLDVAAAALGGGGRAFAVDGIGGPAVNATTPRRRAAAPLTARRPRSGEGLDRLDDAPLLDEGDDAPPPEPWARRLWRRWTAKRRRRGEPGWDGVLAYIYTSGTGLPKAARITHGRACSRGSSSTPLAASPRSAVALRFAFGNGMPRDGTWRDFERVLHIDRVIEFYGSTEGNVNLFNNLGASRSASCARSCPSTRLRRAARGGRRRGGGGGAVLRRDADGLCEFCEPGEVGELLGRVGRTRAGASTAAAATSRKLAEHVKRRGDVYFRSGDLVSFDRLGFLYFADRGRDVPLCVETNHWFGWS